MLQFYIKLSAIFIMIVVMIFCAHLQFGECKVAVNGYDQQVLQFQASIKHNFSKIYPASILANTDFNSNVNFIASHKNLCQEAIALERRQISTMKDITYLFKRVQPYCGASFMWVDQAQTIGTPNPQESVTRIEESVNTRITALEKACQ